MSRVERFEPDPRPESVSSDGGCAAAPVPFIWPFALHGLPRGEEYVHDRDEHSHPATTDIGASAFSSQFTNDVVEIGLLLPTNWANTLIELSKQRHQSVAQVLRAIIGNALHDCASEV